jgi:hypothetical protein
MCYISHKHSCFASYLECCSQPSSALSSSVMNVTKPLHRAWCPKPAHSEQCSQILRGFPAVLCTIAPTFPPTPMLGWKPGSHTAGPVTVYLSVFFVCRSTDFYPPSVLKLASRSPCSLGAPFVSLALEQGHSFLQGAWFLPVVVVG